MLMHCCSAAASVHDAAAPYGVLTVAVGVNNADEDDAGVK